MTKYIFRHVYKGEIVETVFVSATQSEWDASPSAKNPAFSAACNGENVMAMAILSLPCKQTENDEIEVWKMVGHGKAVQL